MFGDITATVSPMPIPRRTSAEASRTQRSYVSRQVRRTAPCIDGSPLRIDRRRALDEREWRQGRMVRGILVQIDFIRIRFCHLQPPFYRQVIVFVIHTGQTKLPRGSSISAMVRRSHRGVAKLQPLRMFFRRGSASMHVHGAESGVTLSEQSESKGPYCTVPLWFHRGASTPHAQHRGAYAQHDNEITAHLLDALL